MQHIHSSACALKWSHLSGPRGRSYESLEPFAAVIPADHDNSPAVSEKVCEVVDGRYHTTPNGTDQQLHNPSLLSPLVILSGR